MALGRLVLSTLLAAALAGAAWSADSKSKSEKHHVDVPVIEPVSASPDKSKSPAKAASKDKAKSKAVSKAKTDTPAPPVGEAQAAGKKPLEATSTKVIAPPPGSAATAHGADPAKEPGAETGKETSTPNVPVVPVAWTDQEIADAKARCTVLLKGVNAVTIPEPAMRTGDCGAPAPVRLISIGSSPEMVFSPPPVLTCEMVAALHSWTTKDLQRLAKKHLGAEIIKIESMSDYSCRNAYGRKLSKLSEHGRANALDIRGFVTARGQLAYVLEGWGETQRDVTARIAAAKAKAEKDAAALAAKAVPATGAAAVATGSTTAAPLAPGAAPGLAKTIVDGAPETGRSQPSFGLSEPPSRLGGPKDSDTAVAELEPKKSKSKTNAGQTLPHAPVDGKVPPAAAADAALNGTPKVKSPALAKFLKEAHISACQIFGTTLGPEANNAHRNHFHVDMAPRNGSNFCE